MLNENTTLYATKDLAEAAALMTRGIKVVDIERESSVCWFIFDDLELSKSLSQEFFFGELQVNARKYHESLSLLKKRIYSN